MREKVEVRRHKLEEPLREEYQNGKIAANIVAAYLAKQLPEKG